VGRFDIRRVLGEGEFGTTYEAYDPQHDRTVALKVAKPAAESQRRARQFLNQIENAHKLRHTNIVPIFEHGNAGDQFYLASALVRGQSLQSLLGDLNANKKTMKPAQAAKVTLILAEALGYAHGLGVVHREVNPSNVLIDENGDPHLIDFGLASEVEVAADYQAPECGARAGTRPENHLSDQYSLGVTMYEMMTGEVPSDQSTTGTGPRIAPSKRNPRIPAALDKICLTCLDKDPTHRYPDYKALAEDLRRFQRGQPVLGRLTVTAARKSDRRWRMAAAVLACILVLGAGAIGVLGYSGALGKWLDHATAGMRFNSAMNRGAKAEQRKDFGAAVDAFDAALKIRPHDVTAAESKARAEQAWLKERREEEQRRRGEDEEPWPFLQLPDR
jgi:serine/threonine protein kinase